MFFGCVYKICIMSVSFADNPVLCDESFPNLSSIVEKLHSRFLGECPVKVPLAISPPLLNDIDIPMPIPLRPGRLFQLIPGRNGELPIIVEPPITLPPATSSSLPPTSLPSTPPTPTLVHYKEPSVLEPAPDTVLHAYIQGN